jgi:hypothetical protein
MLDGEGVEHRVDQGASGGGVVPHAVAQIQHQRDPAARRVVGGVLDRPDHRAGDRHPTAGVVRDLEAEQLCAGRDPVEPGDPEQVMSGRDAGDVRAVPGVVEEETERRSVAHGGEVRRQRERSEREGLRRRRVVADGGFVGERSIAVGIGHHEPAVACLGHDERQAVPRVAVPVDVGGRGRAEGRFVQRSPEVRGQRQPHDAPESAESPTLHRHGIAVRGKWREGNASLTGEVPEVGELAVAGRRMAESGEPRVDAAVQDRDQHAPAVELGVGRDELLGPDRPAGQQAQGHRGLGREDRLPGWRDGDGALVGSCRRGRRAPRRWCAGGAGGRDAQAPRSDQERARGPWAHEPVSGMTNAPRWGPPYVLQTRSVNASMSRVSSGSRMASTKPRAPANLASSWCS